MATQVTVELTQTPARLSNPDSGAVAGQSVAFVNETGVAVRVGGSDVTTSTGLLVAANASFSMDLDSGEPLFAVCASGTHNIQVLRGGV